MTTEDDDDTDDALEMIVENASLQKDILDMINALLTRPQMFAGNAESLEGQFVNLVLVVAPYAYGMTQMEAGEIIRVFAEEITGNHLGISTKVTDIQELAEILQKCYTTYFDVIVEKNNSTLH